MKLTLKFDENNIGWQRKEIFGRDYKKLNWKFLTASCEMLGTVIDKLGSIHLSDIYREFCFDLPDENYIDYKITDKSAILVRDELDDVYTITIELPEDKKISNDEFMNGRTYIKADDLKDLDEAACYINILMDAVHNLSILPKQEKLTEEAEKED